MKSEYYEAYKKTAPCTIKELNAKYITVVKYYEGWMKPEDGDQFANPQYGYRWARVSLTMKELAAKANNPTPEYAGLDRICDEIRKVAALYHKEEEEAAKERRRQRLTVDMRTAWADMLECVEKANQARINYHPQYTALKRARWVEENITYKQYQQDMDIRIDKILKALGGDIDKILKFPNMLNTLSDENRLLLLDRAADFDLFPREQMFYTKDVYTFNAATISDEETEGDLYWVRPFKTYHKPSEGDPLVSCVGKRRLTTVTRAEENEVIAMALAMHTLYGDEFLAKVTTPEGVVTRRDIRLGLVEEEPIEFRDFLTPLYEDKDESELEDDSNLYEDILDDESEAEPDEDVVEDEDDEVDEDIF